MDAVRQDLIARIRASRGRKCVPESGPEVLGPQCPRWLIPKEQYPFSGPHAGEETIDYHRRIHDAKLNNFWLSHEDHSVLSIMKWRVRKWTPSYKAKESELRMNKILARTKGVYSAGRGSF